MTRAMRNSGRLILAVAAATAGIAGGQARGSLLIDVRATGLTSSSGTLVNSKTVDFVSPGDVISYEVYAVVTGAPGNTGLEGFQSAKGTLASSGPGTLQLNLTHALVSPFNGSSSVPGTPTNLGGDSDIDIGTSLTPNNTTSGNIFYRSGSMTPGPANGTSTAEFLIGSGTMTVGASMAPGATVNFIIANPIGIEQNPLWREDGVSKTTATGTRGVGAPITFLPEPSTLGVVAAFALTAAIRRRRQTA